MVGMPGTWQAVPLSPVGLFNSTEYVHTQFDDLWLKLYAPKAGFNNNIYNGLMGHIRTV